MKNKLTVVMLFLGLSLESFVQCSLLLNGGPNLVASWSGVELSAYGESPLRRPSSNANVTSPGPLTSGDTSPESVTKVPPLDGELRVPQLPELPAASTPMRTALPVASGSVRIALPASGCPVEQDTRVKTATLIRRYDDLRLRGSVDTRVSPEGRVVQYSLWKSMARQMSLYNDLPKWQSDLYDNVQMDCPEFIVRAVNDKKMHVSGEFLVGVRSWLVYAINGKENQGLLQSLFVKKENVERAKNNELTARWFASATIEQTSPGVYVTDIETPSLPHFELFGGTGLPSHASLRYEGTSLINGDFLKRLSPLRWVYGE